MVLELVVTERIQDMLRILEDLLHRRHFETATDFWMPKVSGQLNLLFPEHPFASGSDCQLSSRQSPLPSSRGWRLVFRMTNYFRARTYESPKILHAVVQLY